MVFSALVRWQLGGGNAAVGLGLGSTVVTAFPCETFTIAS